MNKSELIAAIASNADLSKKDSEAAVNALIEEITKAIKSGEKVTIPGFITIEKALRKARDGRNPQTGETIKIAAKNYAKFKAGKTLSDSLN